MKEIEPGFKILAIDIGGSHIKGGILNEEGKLLSEYISIETPKPATLTAVINTIKTLGSEFSGFDKISAGFPGFIKDGIVQSAPNLDNDSWHEVDLTKILTTLFNKPVRVANDADMLGLGVASGKGFEMMITLGTGFGTAFLKDGILLPHIELAHHPLSKKYTYDSYVGAAAFELLGRKKWNKRVSNVLLILKSVFNYDRLYIGGGISKNLDLVLESNMRIVSNQDGISGGSKLWKEKKQLTN